MIRKQNQPMKRSRFRWKRYLPLAIVLSLFAMGLALSCARGGGGGSGLTPTASDSASGTGTVAVTGRILGATASALQPATPDKISIIIGKADISTDDLTPIPIFENETDPVDVMDLTKSPIKDGIQVGSYRVLHLTVTKITWSVSWSPGNPSPCDGLKDGSPASGSVDLSGHTDFYFKTPDLGGNTLAYYLSHPPLSGYVGDSNHPFVLASPIQVTKDLPTTVNLVIGVANTLTCDSVDVFDRASGAKKDITLAGAATRLTGADGIYFDPSNQEVGITNSGNNSVTVYDRTALSDPTVKCPTCPTRILIGPDTRLNGPAGIGLYLDQSIPRDPTKDEIVVANQGNDSVTVYSRTASENANPLRTITGTQTGLSGPNGIYVDAVRTAIRPPNNEILVTNSGNDSVTIYGREVSENALPYRTIQGDLTGLSHPCGIYVDPVSQEIGVANTDTNSVTVYSRDDVNKMVGVSRGYALTTSPVRDQGALLNTTFTLDFAETVASPDITITLTPTTTLAELSDMITSQASSRVTATPMDTGSGTTPHRLVITSNLVEPANNVIVGGTLLDEIPDFLSLGNVSPVRTIIGSQTGLSSPCGLYLDTTNNEIAVANSGNNSITIYNRDADGDVAPIRPPISGSGTGLNSPVGIYVDTTRDEIGVVHKGQTVVMAQPPPVFPSSTDGDASLSALAGDYNVVFYGVDIQGVDGNGNTLPLVFAERGIANFDASTTSWPSFSLKLDTQIGRQISKPDCLTGADVDVVKSGFYGVNHDGSFYAFIPGINGSLQGAFLPDGTAFVGSMVDHSKKMMLVYGVKATGNFSPYLTSDGKISGGGTHYAFATYNNNSINYLLWIGMAATDASYLNSMSGDTNIVTASGTLRYSQDDVYLRVISPKPYISHPASPGPSGFLEILSEGLSGAVTADGAALIFARDTVTKDNKIIRCPVDIGFGMGLRTSPAGTFTTPSIKGTYFAASFGDRYEIDKRTRLHRSTAVRLNFDGAGSVEIATIENAAGRISMDRASFTYQVRQRVIPSQGDTQLSVDVVDIFDQQPATGPYATALIGKDGMSLGFFLNPNPSNDTTRPTPNPTRLLGLAVFQHP